MSDDTQETMTVDEALASVDPLASYPWVSVEDACARAASWREDGSFTGDQEVGIVLANAFERLREEANTRLANETRLWSELADQRLKVEQRFRKPVDSPEAAAPSSAKPVNAGDADWHAVGDGAFARPFGTIRQCIGCGALVAGGPTRCVRCAVDSASQPPATSPVEDCGECGHRVDAGECPDCGPLEDASPVDGDAGESKTLKAAIYWMERSNKAEDEVRRLREECAQWKRSAQDQMLSKREVENALMATRQYRDRLAQELERRNVAHVEPAIIARDRDDWKQRAQEAERDRDLFRNASEAAELRIVELRKELAELQAIYDGLCK